MAGRAIRLVLLLVASFGVWLVYRLGHPSPREPGFLYRFRRHPSAIPEYLAYLARGLFHPHLLRTGSTRQERLEALPGDELIPQPRLQETRATTIDVPCDQLWPWIVQMGDRRGGWYWWTPAEVLPEYQRYVINTYTVLDQFQSLNVGDRLSDGGPYATDDRGNWTVRAVEPNRHLILYAGRQMTAGADFDPQQEAPQGIWFAVSWAFVLKPIGPEQTRLIVRLRGVGGPPSLFWLLRIVLKGDTSAHNSMFERIKARSEAYYARARAASVETA